MTRSSVDEARRGLRDETDRAPVQILRANRVLQPEHSSPGMGSYHARRTPTPGHTTVPVDHAGSADPVREALMGPGGSTLHALRAYLRDNRVIRRTSKTGDITYWIGHPCTDQLFRLSPALLARIRNTGRSESGLRDTLREWVFDLGGHHRDRADLTNKEWLAFRDGLRGEPRERAMDEALRGRCGTHARTEVAVLNGTDGGYVAWPITDTVGSPVPFTVAPRRSIGDAVVRLALAHGWNLPHPALVTPEGIERVYGLPRSEEARVLGRGSYGAFMSCSTREDWGVKQAADPKAQRFLRRQADAGITGWHANLTPMLGLHRAHCDSALMPRAMGGSWRQWLRGERGAFPSFWAFEVAADAAAGLAYLHAQRVVHRDIKSGNLVVMGPGGVARLCDFDFAAPLPEAGHDSQPAPAMGSASHTAPWFLGRSVGPDPHTLVACDLWSLGALFVETWTVGGRAPVEHFLERGWKRRGITRYVPQLVEAVSQRDTVATWLAALARYPTAIDHIHQLLNPDPSKPRPSAAQAHRLFQSLAGEEKAKGKRWIATPRRPRHAPLMSPRHPADPAGFAGVP